MSEDIFQMKIGHRVLVHGKQVFNKDDQAGTIINTFSTTIKVQLDNGTKWFVLKEHCTPHVDHM